jgi:HlyD family secretion protein
MPWRRRLLILLFALLGAVLILFLLRPSPVLVDTQPATRGYLAVTLEEEGRTRIVNRYEVFSPMTAQLRRVTLDVGDPVEENQRVITLEPLPSPFLDIRSLAEAEARRDAAEALLETARQEAEAAAAAASFARSELQRLQQLKDRQLISTSELQRAEAEAQRTEALHRSAQFRVRTARSDLDAARAALVHSGSQDPSSTDDISLVSPIRGVVLRRYLESAQVVQPGQPLLELGNPLDLEVEVEVLSSDAIKIEPGMRVLLERWGRPEPLEGRVRRIEPAGFTKISALGVEEQRVIVLADIVSPQERWNRLGDAYRVNARFILWEEKDVLRVATSALFRHEHGWAVFLIDGNRARLQPVTIGRRGELHTQVLEGLQPGETVIVHPDRSIEKGTRIRTRERGNPPP